MDIDVIVDSRQSQKQITELGLLAERHGIRAIWNSSYLDGRDPFTNFAELARESSRIHMGAIALNGYEQHPFRITMSLLTLNEICDGRAEVIIGGGGEVVMALDIPLERRVRVVRECAEFVKGATTERPFNYNGELYKVINYNPQWATAPAPTVYVAANRPQMLRISARVADGIMMSDLSTNLSKNAINDVKAHLKEFDRSTDDFRFNNFMAWYVYEDREEALREAKQWIGFRALFREYMMSEFMTDEEFDIIMAHIPQIYEMAAKGTYSVEGVPDRLLDLCVEKLTLTGGLDDLDKIIGHLQELKDVGMAEVTLELRSHAAESIKIIGEQVIPALR